MVARRPDDWEQITHWLDPSAHVGRLTSHEWLIQEQARLQPRHRLLIIRTNAEGFLALFSAGLVDPPDLRRERVTGAREYQDLGATIPDWVPRPTDLSRQRGVSKAWRLGYLASVHGMSQRTCPYARSGKASFLRGVWTVGYRAHQEIAQP